MSQYFGKAVQTAYVVPDVDAAIQRWAGIGVGPFFVLREQKIPARYRGERNDILLTAAFGYSGSMMYELVQQHDDTPSAYREFLARHPQGGFHHVAYFCNDFATALKRAKSLGKEFTTVQEFITPDGTPFEIYIEPATDEKDPLVVQLMINGAYGTFFEQMEAAAVDWDGRQPVRSALDLLPQQVRPGN